MKKILKVLGTLVLICIIALTAFFAYMIINVTVPDKMNYIVNADQETCTITGTKNRYGTTLVIPEEIKGYTVTRIAPYAFQESSFDMVVFPSTIEVIGEGAFDHCKKLMTITGLEKCTSLKTIDDNTFSYCEVLSSIVLPENIEKIGAFAFIGCYDLFEINIPDKVTTIGYWAFASCGLKNITLPASVEYIEPGVFRGCTDLDSINVDKDNAEFCSVNGVVYSKDMKTLFMYPTGKQDIEFTVLDGVTTIFAEAFADNYHLEIINIPSSVVVLESDILYHFLLQKANDKVINYNGTVEMWNSIIKAEEWDIESPNYTIYCTDGRIKKDGTVIYN